MPYIEKKAREKFEPALSVIFNTKINSVGELNYLLTSIIKTYLAKHGSSYTTYNGVMGVLHCCGLELYRRLVVPYENEKKEDNGEVF